MMSQLQFGPREPLDLSAIDASASTYITGREFGHTGGLPFDLRRFNTLAIRTGKLVDGIYIDDVLHGGIGGTLRSALNLGFGEYISGVDVCHADFIYHLNFTTNFGRSMSGGEKLYKCESLANIRLLAISGRSGGYVDRLYFEYVHNYIPTRVVEKNAPVIIRVLPPNTLYRTVKSVTSRILESVSSTLSWTITVDTSVSAKVELIGEVEAKTGVKVEYKDVKQMSREIEETIKKEETEEHNTKEDYAYRFANYDIYEDENGSELLIPLGEPSTISLKPDYDKTLLNDMRCLDANALMLATGLKFSQTDRKVPRIIVT